MLDTLRSWISGKPIPDKNDLQDKYRDISGATEVRISQAHSDFQSAIERLHTISEFSKLYSQEELWKLFPLIVKESSLDNTKVSRTGAVGYMQLKPDAIKDATNVLRNRYKISKNYDTKNGVDNCLLGIIYYAIIQERISGFITKDIPQFSFLSYNMGSERLRGIVAQFSLENQKKEMSWENFVSWFAKKNGVSGVARDVKETVYNITYRDWFDGKDFTQDDSIVVFGNTNIKRSKSQESVNYVEKIIGIGKKSPMLRSTTTQPKTPVEYRITEESVEGLPRKGEGVYGFLKRYGLVGPEAVGSFEDINDTETIKEGSWYKLPIIVKKCNNTSFGSCLREIKLDPKHDNKIFRYNQVYNPNFSNITKINDIKPGIPLYIPKWNTGFYENPLHELPIATLPNPPKGNNSSVEGKKELKPQTVPTETQETIKGDFEFYKWINSIKPIDNKLKGKVFILDPGHGGVDFGAHPIARDKSGAPIKDPNSAIKVVDEAKGKTQRVGSLQGSGYLHVYESRVTVDICYRIAQKIKQSGGEVHITRYNKASGIDARNNSTTPGIDDDVDSQSKTPWKNYSEGKGKGGQRKSLHRRGEIASKIYKSSPNKSQTYFLAIHADSHDKSKDLPISYKYYSGREGTYLESQKFARNLAQNTPLFRKQEAIAGGQPLGVLGKNNAVEKGVLVEVGNMRNSGVAYLLRQPQGRQQFADAIFSGIVGAASR